MATIIQVVTSTKLRGHGAQYQGHSLLEEVSVCFVTEGASTTPSLRKTKWTLVSPPQSNGVFVSGWFSRDPPDIYLSPWLLALMLPFSHGQALDRYGVPLHSKDPLLLLLATFSLACSILYLVHAWTANNLRDRASCSPLGTSLLVESSPLSNPTPRSPMGFLNLQWDKDWF